MVREYVYVYAGVCPQLGRMSSVILPYANTEMMNLFIKQLGEDFKEYFVVMVTDRAGWHTSKGLEVPENIRLLPLPSYSPELNPAEHVWEELREKDLPNWSFDSLDQLEENLCRGLNRLSAHPDYLRSLTNFPYMQLTL